MRISIKAALAGLFSMLAIIVVAQGALALLRLGGIRHSAEQVATNWLPSMQVLGELTSAVDKARVRQFRLVAATRGAQQLDEHRQMYLTVTDRVAQIR